MSDQFELGFILGVSFGSIAVLLVQAASILGKRHAQRDLKREDSHPEQQYKHR